MKSGCNVPLEEKDAIAPVLPRYISVCGVSAMRFVSLSGSVKHVRSASCKRKCVIVCVNVPL